MINTNKKDLDIHSEKFLKVDKEIAKLNKISEDQEDSLINLAEYKEKVKSKFKKYKKKIENGLAKNSLRINECDNNLKNIYPIVLKLNNQKNEELNNNRGNDNTANNENRNQMPDLILPLDNSPSFPMFFSGSQIDDLREEFNEKFDKVFNSAKINKEEIEKIKKYLAKHKNVIENNNNKIREEFNFDPKEIKIVQNENIEEIKISLQKFDDIDTLIKDKIFEKVGKDELEILQKSFTLELDKLVINLFI